VTPVQTPLGPFALWLFLIATVVNQRTENIGARRLHTIMERLLEEISFQASEIAPTRIVISADYVRGQLSGIAKTLT
jgi:ATP-dependent HslUV protease ATP-binding subunit HslU